MIELLSFCTATFRKSLAKVTRPAAAPPLRTSILKTACCTSRPVSLLDTTLWTSSPETSAPHILTSSIRLMESHKPAQRRDSGMGLRSERRGPRLHRTGCRHCSRWQDRRALRFPQSQICIAHRGTLAAYLASALPQSADLDLGGYLPAAARASVHAFDQNFFRVAPKISRISRGAFSRPKT
jgi:hypothetical protein